MKILLAIDGSRFSEAATQALIERIKPEDAEVYVLTVLDLMNYFTSEAAAKAYIPQIDEIRHDRLKMAKELIDRTTRQLQAAGFEVSSGISEGDPKTRIVEVAEQRSIDLIVMGSHGRKGFDRALLGSVSEAVARYASCSIEIVRIRPGR